MKSKKILFYLPTIFLLIYIIIYGPLLTYLLDTLVPGSGEKIMKPMEIDGAIIEIPVTMIVTASDVNDIMNNISICIVALAIILKAIFRKKKCGIGEIPSVVNLTIFVLLIICIFLLGGLTAFS